MTYCAQTGRRKMQLYANCSFTHLYVTHAVPPAQHKGSGDGVRVFMSYRMCVVYWLGPGLLQFSHLECRLYETPPCGAISG